MRVALNLEQLLQQPPGGIGRYVAALARLLPGARNNGGVELIPFVARHDVVDIATALGEHGLSDRQVVVTRLPRPLLYDAWNVLGRPALASESPRLRDLDVVHAPSVAVPPRQDGAALVVTVHDAAPIVFPETYPRRGRWFHRRGFDAAARRADLVITVSEAAADEITSHTSIERERIRVVHHGIGLTMSDEAAVDAARALIGVDEPYVLWTGTFEPRKNVDVLIEAFGRLVASDPALPHRLVLIGPRVWRGAARSAVASASALGARVVLPGPVPHQVLRPLYRGAAVFAFPSIHEGFGLPVLEALSQGAAVLSADVAALREVAGDAATFVPPDDPDAWADALGRVLRSDDAERTVCSTAAIARAAQFSEQRFVDATVAVYREAIEVARS